MAHLNLLLWVQHGGHWAQLKVEVRVGGNHADDALQRLGALVAEEECHLALAALEAQLHAHLRITPESLGT